MKIAIAQFNPRVGDISQNVIRIAEWIEQAKEKGAELVVFPELAVTGYPPKDFLSYPSFVDSSETAITTLSRVAKGIAVVVGFVEKNTTGIGAPFYNSAAVLSDGQCVERYRKQLLPTYDVFDESRYFEPGNQACVFEVSGVRFGLTICEDAWNFPNLGMREYPQQPLDAYRRQKLNFLINLSASPFHLGKPDERIQLFSAGAQRVGSPLIVCNQVGGNDELIFDGCSLVVEPSGSLLWKGQCFVEALEYFDTNKTTQLQPWGGSEAAWLWDALVLGVRDYASKSGVTQACLGLSGGIDSAVTLCVAAEALGPEAVSAVSLPTRYTSSASVEDAQALADQLKVSFRNISVDGLFDAYQNLWKEQELGGLGSLTLENLQPRIRMTVLMALANEENRLLLNTSNKSEIATGYATLYGDSAGALSVLGDLTKRQVYLLANYLHEMRSWIPKRIIDRPPTAELREGQRDEESLPPYSVLDELVVAVVEKGWGKTKLLESGFDSKWVELFCRLHRVSEYKRNQLPPVLRVSRKAFGVGRRLPIAAKMSFLSE